MTIARKIPQFCHPDESRYRIHTSFASSEVFGSSQIIDLIPINSVIPTVSRDPDYQPVRKRQVWVPTYRRDDKVLVFEFNALDDEKDVCIR